LPPLANCAFDYLRRLTQNHLGVRSAKFQTRYGHIAALAAKKKAHAD